MSNIFILTGDEEEQFDPTSWEGLPEFIQEENEAPFLCVVRFRSEKDLFEFADLIKYPILKNKTKRNTKSIWFPELAPGERGSSMLNCWEDEEEINERG